ncbi:alpha/beta fold hydrolase [Nonomuraea sp. NPDC050404]|uniref:alpha/beta fold hydrolase n=1 Tax=Nonomuraea sp. NPDC050404 TaxID=3155783 RepID=UPI0033C07812
MLAFALVGAPLTATPAASADQHECAVADKRCDGRISVPLDWDDPRSERISVAFAWLPRTDRSRPATGTVLANPGGIAPALPAVPTIAAALGPVLQRQNLLVVEPRGHGESSPLLCPGLDLAEQRTIAACAAQLGPKTAFYTSDQAVRDMDAVRQALGVPKVSFYGNSYGTILGPAYATRFPRNTAAVFLDSVVSIGADGYARASIATPMSDHDDVCRPSPACRKLPGDPRGTWSKLVRHLRAEPDSALPITTLRAVGNVLTDPAFGRETAAAATAYLAGDRRPLHRLGKAVGDFQGMPLKDPTYAGMLAYYCGDFRHPYDREASPAERRRQLDHYYATERPFEPFVVEELAGPFGWQDWCVSWPTPRESPPVPPGADYPDVPALGVGGQLDDDGSGAEVLGRFPGGRHITIPFGSHSVSLNQRPPLVECVRKEMRRFLERLAAGRPVCSAATYQALGSFPRTIDDVPPARGAGLSVSERRLLAVAFGTATDALHRRNPYSALYGRLKTEAGLRGGQVSFDDDQSRIRLDQVRYTGDVAVTGVVHPEGRAVLTVRDRRVEFTWDAFRAEESTRIQGTLDGRAFKARIPAH